MDQRSGPGLGELLRYVSELVEQGAEDHYKEMGLHYRARYTPVLRAIQAGAKTVTEITANTHLTQGAISQAVGQMEADGLLSRYQVQDARKSGLQLTSQGKTLLVTLNRHWEATFEAIDVLESEIGHPLRRMLVDVAAALKRQGFGERLKHVKTGCQYKE